jgi:hypothetical protein
LELLAPGRDWLGQLGAFLQNLLGFLAVVPEIRGCRARVERRDPLLAAGDVKDASRRC